MSSSTHAHPEPGLQPRPDHAIPTAMAGTLRLLRDQLAYSLVDLWRSRIAFLFTFLLPLTFLLVIGALVGDAVAPGSDVGIMQFVVPGAAVMGALYGSFPTIAASLADARERGVVKRVRGTPLPMWVYLGGRLGAAVLMALGSLMLMLVVGVVAYGVQIQWTTMPATAVTVVLAVTSFAATGVAVAGVARSAALAMSGSIAAAVVLSYLAGLMGNGEMPEWANRISAVFPVKPFDDALERQFDPAAAGSGWDLGALAVILAWLAAGTAVAVRTFRAEPAQSPGALRRRAPDAPAVPATAGAGELTAVAVGRPGPLQLLAGQVQWATKAALRDLGWVFFAIAMPLALYVLTTAMMPTPVEDVTPPLALQLATGMIVWGAVVTGLVNLPEAVARARDAGVLKRLRGTPLPVTAFFAGRALSALAVVVATAALILAIGMLWFGLAIAWQGLPLALALLVLGTATVTACGMLLAAVLPNGKAVVAVGLALAIPVAFFSDIFAIAFVPDWMSTIGSVLPVKPMTNAMASALDPGGTTIDGTAMAVMTAWLVGASLLAVRTFRWSPRR